MAKYAAPDITEIAGTAAVPERFDIVRMARLLDVSTSGYHQWRKRSAATDPTPRQQRRADLAVKILDGTVLHGDHVVVTAAKDGSLGFEVTNREAGLELQR